MDIKYIALDFGGVVAYKQKERFYLKDDATNGLLLIQNLHIPCTIWTNGTNELFSHITQLGLWQYFNPHLICNSFNLPEGANKPDIAFFKEATRLLQVEYSNVLFIDDTLENVSSASTLGINSILYENPLDKVILKGLKRSRRKWN